jgi:hypothetical protein
MKAMEFGQVASGMCQLQLCCASIMVGGPHDAKAADKARKYEQEFHLQPQTRFWMSDILIGVAE